MAKGELSEALRLPKTSNRIRELRALIVDEDRHMRKLLRMLLLGYVYQRTHRIVPSIVAHGLFNLLTMLTLWRMVLTSAG